MKKIALNFVLTSLIVLPLLIMTNCRKVTNPVVYEKGQFPDTVLNMQDLNSEYDDYNLDIYSLYANVPLIYSSNRGSEGGKFDFVQGVLSYAFDQTNGNFLIGAEPVSDPFLTKLLEAVNTEGNDFGPYRLYNADDGYEYLVLASETPENGLDFFYTKNLPVFGSGISEVFGPYPLNLINSPSNDAYISFNIALDTIYFSSDLNGNFDIYTHVRPADAELTEWLDKAYETSQELPVFNSESDDKCPYILGKYMVFASDRPGGLGGFDLYYSELHNGTWSTPVNFGAPINTASDEYRPVLGGHTDFSNIYIMFSSNRPGGKGGFDLYFTGLDLSL